MAELNVRSKIKGNEIELVNEKWIFCDTKELVEETWHKRSCGVCLKKNTKEGHDYCLGNLPKVMNACCGHGQVNEAYIQFQNRIIIRGIISKVIFYILKVIR